MQSATLNTSDLIDAHPEARSCALQFRMFGERRSFFGRIRTVLCCEDNALIRETLSRPSAGEVLVIDGGGSLRCALVGDTLATLGMNAGWSGVVINGAVRDTVALDKLAFGVRALGTNPLRCHNNGAGQVDVPVTFGGVTFQPGAWLCCDEDGVIVSSASLL